MHSPQLWSAQRGHNRMGMHIRVRLSGRSFRPFTNMHEEFFDLPFARHFRGWPFVGRPEERQTELQGSASDG